MNLRLVKRDPEAWVSSLAPRWNGGFGIDEIEAFFMLKLEAVSDASLRYRIPLEVNGNTQYRIRVSNLPAALQMLWAAYAFFRERGVELVPGSDQHGFTASVGRIGGAVPADCFHALGMGAGDIGFLKRIEAPVSLSSLR